MNSQRLLLAAFAVLAAVAAAYLGTRDSGASRTSPTAPPGAGAESSPSVEAAGERPALADPAPGSTTATAPVETDRVRRSVSTPLSPGELHGALTVADGGPLGEAVRIHAAAAVEDGAATVEPTLIDVGADGSFVLPVPVGVTAFVLRIQAEFLALAEPAEIDVAAGSPFELVARRGACLIVDLTGPGADLPEARPSARFEVYAARSPGASQPRITAFLGDDGRLCIGGLDPDETHWVALDAERFVPAQAPVPRLRTNERTAMELSIARGVAASGRIVDEEGVGISGAMVRLGSWEHMDMRSSIGREASVRSSETGHFDVGGVVNGAMTLRVSADGYEQKTESLGQRLEGDVVEGLQLVLTDGGAVRGVAIWPDGTPATDARVRLAQVGATWSQARKTEVDENGAFEFTGLRGGPFRVRAMAEEGDSAALRHRTVTAVIGQNLRLELAEGPDIAGRVVDERGQPVEDFRVRARAVGRDRAGQDFGARGRNSDGSFVIESMTDGAFDIIASAKGHAESSPMRVVIPETTEPLVLTVPRLADVRGRIVDSAMTPMADVPMGVQGRTVTSDAEGLFHASGIKPGELHFRVLAPRFGVVRSEPPVIAPGVDRDDVIVVLGRGARVLGQLHSSLVGGIHSRANLRRQNEFSMDSTEIAADGSFAFEGLDAGSYWVSLAPVQGRPWTESFRETRPLPVDVLMDSDVPVVLGDPESYALTMTGKVTRAGAPATELLMYVYAHTDERTFPAAITRTTDEGRYSFTLRVPGRYSFNIGEGQTAQARFVVDVSGESMQERDFELPDRVLEGRATLSDGTPAAGRMYVLAHADAPMDSIQVGELQFTQTRGDGTFKFEGLHPGTYRLHTGNYTRGHETDGLVIVKDIEVPAKGKASEVSIRIPRGAIVDCHVVGPGDRPRANCDVRLLDGDGCPCVIYDMSRSNAAGHLRCTGVGPGRWTAVVRDPRGKVIGTESVTVGAGEATEITIRCEG